MRGEALSADGLVAGGRRLIAAIGLAASALAPASTPTSDAPRFAPWIDGTTPAEAATQVQRIDGDTFVIRQSIRTNFEAPFLYLLLGRRRALLIDSGAGGVAIRPTVERLIAEWRARHHGTAVDLIVAHSHGHGDHHAGDGEFAGRPDTRVVGLTPDQVAAFFRIRDWPRGLGHLDLGGRRLDVIATPGHEPAHVMVYDRRTGLLFSGDMLYPGRLYVPLDRFSTFRDSAERLAAFAATHPVRALLGAHIEMTTVPGIDFAMRATAHPGEHPLPMPPSAIDELRRAMSAPAPVIDRHTDFILYPLQPRPTS